jgi:uncharacterized damage-inducible protein DinB
MAAALPDEKYRRDAGAYFRSLHHARNHLPVTDRIWMRRLSRQGNHPDKLDAILFDDMQSLRGARQAEDARLVSFVQGLGDADFEKPCAYRTLSGAPQRQPLAQILAHLFNHQTHHRGQAHAILTQLGVAEPEPLELLIMLREKGRSASNGAGGR